MENSRLYYNIAELDWLYYPKGMQKVHGDFDESFSRGQRVAESIIDLFDGCEYKGEITREKKCNFFKGFATEEIYTIGDSLISLKKVCFEQESLNYPVVTEILFKLTSSKRYCLNVLGEINGIADSYYKKDHHLSMQHSVEWLVTSNGLVVVQSMENDHKCGHHNL